jgi:hypothetical protein
MIRRSLLLTLFAALPALTGCHHFTHSTPAEWRPSDHVPDESKSCVFIFLIDSNNPLATTNLAGVREFLHHIGFGKTFEGQPCHVSYFIEKMQSIQARCGSARFVVIGWDSGAEAAQELAAAGIALGLPMELAIYLEPGEIEDWADPESIAATFTVRAEDLNADGSDKKVRRSDVPTHPQTLELIERELTLIGFTVPPPPRPDAPRVLLVEPIPPPRKTAPRPRELSDDWQFLRPKHPWQQPPPVLRRPTEPLPLPKVVPELPPPKPKQR